MFVGAVPSAGHLCRPSAARSIDSAPPLPDNITEKGAICGQAATGADLANGRSMFGKLISTVLVLLTVAMLAMSGKWG